MWSSFEDSYMKVFLSWSGARSKKVALIFRDWLPSVIQSIEAFVSSEDIEKGARWNTDIAQELKEAIFGIICVTKDNLSTPWLNFEAGALSKTIENTYVAPFLFDVKPSELTGSPISQFQATSFNKEDVKRLVETLNIAAGSVLAPQRLDTAFNLWYVSLEDQLKTLLSEKDETEELSANADILEEILETSRNTQRLIGNTDTKLYNNLEQLQKKTEELLLKNDSPYLYESKKLSRRYSPMFYEELLYSNNLVPYNILIVLSVFRDDFPWLYDAGKDLVSILNSNTSKKNKIEAIGKFRGLLEITSEHPLIKGVFGNLRKESAMILRELSRMLMHVIDEYNDENNL
jgi:hypothetical protein